MTTIAEGRLIDRFVEQLMKWPGVQEVTGDNLGERSLRVGGREFLHTHGDSTLHIQLTKDVKAEVLAKGQAEQHPSRGEAWWPTTSDPMRSLQRHSN